MVGYIVVIGEVCDFFDVRDEGWGDEAIVQPASECAFFISVSVGFCVWVKVSEGVYKFFIVYRVFNRNLGKLIAYLSGLFLVIWAETYGKS